MLCHKNKINFLLTIVGVLLITAKANAFDINFEAGESYSYLSNSTSLYTDPAKHSGLGYLGELHVGFGKRKKGASLELFGLYETGTLTNIDSSVVETNKRTGYGGGLDLFIKYVFIGAGFERVNSDIVTNGTLSANLKYNELSVRAGAVITISNRLSLIAGGLVGTGKSSFTSTAGTSYDANITNFRGFLLLSFSLFGDGKSTDK